MYPIQKVVNEIRIFRQTHKAKKEPVWLKYNYTATVNVSYIFKNFNIKVEQIYTVVQNLAQKI